MPVRWYYGRFELEGRRLRIPVARGCPPLQVRLDRDLPYPADQVRSVTLLYGAGRLWVDVTAEVPAVVYSPGAEPDPGRVAGVDLGIIHPYAVAGPGGQALLVSGRAIRAECRMHLKDAKARQRAVGRRAPKPGQRGSRRWRHYRRRQRLVEARHAAPGPPGPARSRPRRHRLGRRAPDRHPRGRRPARRPGPRGGAAAQPAHSRLARRPPDHRPARQGSAGRDYRGPDRRAGHLFHLPGLPGPGPQAARPGVLLPALRAGRPPRPDRGGQHRRAPARRQHVGHPRPASRTAAPGTIFQVCPRRDVTRAAALITAPPAGPLAGTCPPRRPPRPAGESLAPPRGPRNGHRRTYEEVH